MTDKRLFTPGPLTTSGSVKAAMLRDLGSRDGEFIALVAAIRQQLLALAGAAEQPYETILMQGSGTFGLEAVISSITPENGRWLIIVNGAYGRRLVQIAERHNINTLPLSFPENQPPDLAQIEATLKAHTNLTHLALVHCETTTGLINPLAAIGQLARQHNLCYVVDAMSSFGGIPLNLTNTPIDFLISSANKCIEGVPGFSFILAQRDALLATEGLARTVSLDLLAQWRALEQNGQFRFTPPTHALLAFHQSLHELFAEGGVTGRATRYQHNYETLITGMRQLGFQEYLAPANQGYIITSFYYPDHPRFQFAEFYQRLNERGFVIYPGKVSNADCFRIGTIGRLSPTDMTALLQAIGEVLVEMDVDMGTGAILAKDQRFNKLGS